MLNCLAVGAGGCIGSVLRYLIGLIDLKESIVFPYKTLAINVVGSFFIGLIVALALKNHKVDPRLILFLKVGICGGFTTFSTFALESLQLFQTQKIVAALLYIILSIVLSILAIFLAQSMVK